VRGERLDGSLRVRPRLRDHGGLLLACIGSAAFETVLVWITAPRASLGLATQVSAPPPFDVFHDLRWLVVYHESWVGFAFELVAFVAFRSLMTTCLVRTAWPADVPREPVAATVRRSVVFTVVAGLLLAPWAGLLFALAVVSLSWLFFVAVPVTLFIALLVHGGAVTGGWWARTLPFRSMGLVLLAFATLTVFGSLLATCPAVLRLPVAVLAGVANAWLWLRLVDVVLHRPVPVRFVPVAPVGIVLVLALLVGGTTIAFAIAQSPVGRYISPTAAAALPTQWAPVGVAAGAPLLVVTGFNTQWNGRPAQFVHLAVAQRRFSYRGMANGKPLAYTRDDTHRSLRDLARELRSQVDAYHAETGRPITIVAESEGSLLAKTYLAATPGAPVRNLVILSPLVSPGRVYYPAGGTQGWGEFGALEMSGLAWALGGVSPVSVTPDTPFLRSIVDQAPAFRGLMACSLPHVRQVAVIPLDTGVSAPAPASIGIPFTVVPGFHGGMLGNDKTAEVVQRVISGRPVERESGWSFAEDVIQAGATPWQVPQLTTSINAAWSHQPDPSDCAAVRAHLAAWVGS
jgi:hypothetical protein